jgi:hypothetical protein
MSLYASVETGLINDQHNDVLTDPVSAHQGRNTPTDRSARYDPADPSDFSANEETTRAEDHDIEVLDVDQAFFPPVSTDAIDALVSQFNGELQSINEAAQLTNGQTQEQMAKMEREMSNLQGQYKMVEQTYGQDVLNLVLAKGYLAKLLENKSVARYLKQRQPDVLAEFETIVQTVSLDQ